MAIKAATSWAQVAQLWQNKSLPANQQASRLSLRVGLCYVDVMESLTAADILGPEGRIAARLPNYELRPEQLEMAEAVARAIAAKRHLVAEAGTGVGKSFAYLVPAILAATDVEAGGSPASGRGPLLASS